MAASAVNVDVNEITGEFDLSVIKRYNNVFLTKYIATSQSSVINFCMEVGLLPKKRQCSYCKRDLKLVSENRPNNKTPVVFRCFNRGCRKYSHYISVKEDTLFDKSHLSFETILRFVFLYVAGISNYEQLKHECFDGESQHELSTATICDWLTYLREIQLEALIRHSSGKIGGPNYTVEIDEAKFGKRKYNRGRVVEGQWVVGGICRETGDIFVALCPDNKRDSSTLVAIINDHVNSQSTIITDCWKGYDQLERDNWVHLTVNHSCNFVDPETGAHTQNNENTWWQLKRNLPSTHAGAGGNLMLHFADYLWRRKFIDVDEHLCVTFIRHATELYPGRQ